jgi:hypothetical protein
VKTEPQTEARFSALAVLESMRRDRENARKHWRLVALSKFLDPAVVRVKATDARLANWPDDSDWFQVLKPRNRPNRPKQP